MTDIMTSIQLLGVLLCFNSDDRMMSSSQLGSGEGALVALKTAWHGCWILP